MHPWWPCLTYWYLLRSNIARNVLNDRGHWHVSEQKWTIIVVEHLIVVEVLVLQDIVWLRHSHLRSCCEDPLEVLRSTTTDRQLHKHTSYHPGDADTVTLSPNDNAQSSCCHQSITKWRYVGSQAPIRIQGIVDDGVVMLTSNKWDKRRTELPSSSPLGSLMPSTEWMERDQDADTSWCWYLMSRQPEIC